MTSADKLEKSLQRVHDWIKAADQKVATVFAVEGLILTLSTPGISHWYASSYLTATLGQLGGGLVAISTFLYSFVKLAHVLTPRLAVPKGSYRSTTFFEHIGRMKIEDFRQGIEAEGQKDYKEELITQIYYSSKICLKKHSHLRDALILLLVSALLACGVLLSLLVSKPL